MIFRSWKRRQSLEEMLVSLAQCGISLREGISTKSLFRYETREESKTAIEQRGFEMLLTAMGAEDYDVGTRTFCAPPSDDVWHFDAEFIENHGAYKTIVDQLCRLTRGDLVFDEVKDYVDVEAQIAWVELFNAGETERLDLVVNNDWTDPRIFGELQRRLIAGGSERRFATHVLGQDCLIVCQSAKNLKALNRSTGLRFTTID